MVYLHDYDDDYCELFYPAYATLLSCFETIPGERDKNVNVATVQMMSNKNPYLDTSFGQSNPHGKLFPSEHIRIMGP